MRGFFMAIKQLSKQNSRQNVKERMIRFQGEVDKFFWHDDPNIKIELVSGAAGTGKSFAAISKIFKICEEQPGTRAVFFRQSRVNLSESVMATFENMVLPHGHPVKPGPRDAKRANRKSYHFPNGSTILCLGMEDNASFDDDDSIGGRLKSFEYDVALLEECTEFGSEAIQMAFSRLRGQDERRRFIMCLFNPASDSQHHIYSLIGKKGVSYFKTTHHDNPHYWKPNPLGTETSPAGVRGNLTTAGTDYVENTLGMLTGSMMDRFRIGTTSYNPALVHPEFDPALHTVDEDASFLTFVMNLDLTPEEKTKWITDNFNVGLSCDWGSAHVGTVQIFVHPHDTTVPQFDGKMWQYRRVAEFYKTSCTSDEMGKAAINFCGYDYDPETETVSRIENELGFEIPLFDEDLVQSCRVITDHNLESRILFEGATGLGTELANKTIDSGLKLVSKVLRENRLIIDLFPPILGPDYYHGRSGKPTGLHMEFTKYKWQRGPLGFGSAPRRINDDGCTALRYYLVGIEGLEDKPATVTTAKKLKYNDSPVTIWQDEENSRDSQLDIEYLFGRSNSDDYRQVRF